MALSPSCPSHLSTPPNRPPMCNHLSITYSNHHFVLWSRIVYKAVDRPRPNHQFHSPLANKLKQQANLQTKPNQATMNSAVVFLACLLLVCGLVLVTLPAAEAQWGYGGGFGRRWGGYGYGGYGRGFGGYRGGYGGWGRGWGYGRGYGWYG